MVIKIEPPLPCGTLHPDEKRGMKECGKPASAATVDRVGAMWIMMPICKDCTIKTAANYGLIEGETKKE
jgi:hypothetical protein